MRSKPDSTRSLAALMATALTLAILAGSSIALAGSSRTGEDPNGNQGNSRVLPPSSNPFGASYATWSARWWQWAYSLPVAGHPLFDETGADCAAGQSGPVWFLGGVFNTSGTVVRDLCAVPAGKGLFFPILNTEWHNSCPADNQTIAQLYASAAYYMNLATDLQCEIDGRSIANIAQYRFIGSPFAVDIPEGNIWQFFGCPTGPGHYTPLVPDGYYLMLAPLTPGKHTLHFKGTIGDPVNFTPETTYHLTVLPDSHEVANAPGTEAGTGAAQAIAGSVPPNTTWGRVKSTYR